MSIRSKNMDDIESEIGHLAVLIGTITDIAFEIPGSDPTMHRVQGLLWIARDLSGRLVETVEVCHGGADAVTELPRVVGGARS